MATWHALKSPREGYFGEETDRLGWPVGMTVRDFNWVDLGLKGPL